MKPAKHLPKFCLAPSSLIRNSAGQKLFSISPAFLAHEKCSGNFFTYFCYQTETIDLGDEDGEIECDTDREAAEQ